MRSLCTMLALFISTTLFAQVSEEVLVVKARVDGPSDLILTTNGIYWVNGANAKPGRHEGRNDPTYINETPWIPQWGEQEKDRGVDRSTEYPFQIETLDLAVELLAVGQTPEATTVEPRTPIAVTPGADSLIISIPDPESGSRWYILSFSRTTRGQAAGK
jgi:hypothetical protein